MGGSKPKKPKPTESEKAESEHSWQEYQHWRSQYLPMEQQQINDVMTLERETPAMIRKASGNVMSEFAPAFSAAKGQLFHGGIDPSSGHYVNAIGTVGSGAARTAGDVVNDTILNERARKMGAMGGLIGIGRGLAGQSNLNLSRMTSMESASQLAKRRADAYKDAATANMWGTIGGSVVGGLASAYAGGAFKGKPKPGSSESLRASETSGPGGRWSFL